MRREPISDSEAASAVLSDWHRHVEHIAVFALRCGCVLWPLPKEYPGEDFYSRTRHLSGGALFASAAAIKRAMSWAANDRGSKAKAMTDEQYERGA